MKDLRDWIDVIFKVVLAVAGVVFGYYFSYQKQQNDDIKLIVELVAAPESAKRIMGASIAQAYFSQNRVPEEFYLAVYSYANNTGDQQLQAVVNSGAAATSKEQPSIRQALAKASSALPVRIYFHIRQPADRDAARTIERIVESSVTPGGSSIVVPGIELIDGTQRKSVLKCFKKAECDPLGTQLVKIFHDNRVPIELSDQSAAYEHSTSLRPNHFEAWFAPGLAEGQRSSP